MHKYWLIELVSKGKVIEYTYTTSTDNDSWIKARGLLARFSGQDGNKKPRKVQKLYQTNFFLFGNNSLIIKPPVLKEVNIDLFAFFNRFASGKNIPEFSLNILNMLLCHLTPGVSRDAVRLAVYAPDVYLEQASRDLFERFLEMSDDKRVKLLLFSLPFKPDHSKAVAFIRSIVK